jgi:hypothetical protein
LKTYEIDSKDIAKQTQKIVKSVKLKSSIEDKAKAALALSVLSLLSSETDGPLAQQFLKFIKEIQR